MGVDKCQDIVNGCILSDQVNELMSLGLSGSADLGQQPSQGIALVLEVLQSAFAGILSPAIAGRVVGAISRVVAAVGARAELVTLDRRAGSAVYTSWSGSLLWSQSLPSTCAV